jgi:hypothetical protein
VIITNKDTPDQPQVGTLIDEGVCEKFILYQTKRILIWSAESDRSGLPFRRRRLKLWQNRLEYVKEHGPFEFSSVWPEGLGEKDIYRAES